MDVTIWYSYSNLPQSAEICSILDHQDHHFFHIWAKEISSNNFTSLGLGHDILSWYQLFQTECKWFTKEAGCKIDKNCEFVHVTSACDDSGVDAHKAIAYKWEGCSGFFESEHTIQNSQIFFRWIVKIELLSEIFYFIFVENKQNLNGQHKLALAAICIYLSFWI